MSDSRIGSRSDAAWSGDGTDVEELPDDGCVSFITGFPCTRFTCPGTLTRGGYAGREAVVCSTCEHVYYLVADD